MSEENNVVDETVNHQENSNVEGERMLIKPIPRTSQGLLAQRMNQKTFNLHDQVEQIVTDLIPKDEFFNLIDAVYPEQSIEGSLLADDHEAARMVREYGKANGFPVVAHQKIQTLMRSIKVVLRRYKLGRGQRLIDSK